MIDVRGVISKELKRQWAVFFRRLTILLRRVWRLPIEGVKDLSFSGDEVDYIMRSAKVTLSWVASPSDDVVSQHVKVVDPDDGQIFYDETVGREVTSVVLPSLVSEKQKLQAVIVVSDGLNKSDAVVADWTVPDLTKPAPVFSLAFTYEVVDEPDTEDESIDSQA